eukprot:6214172-Pleurochrysis_carterae.AAC.3
MQPSSPQPMHASNPQSCVQSCVITVRACADARGGSSEFVNWEAFARIHPNYSTATQVGSVRPNSSTAGSDLNMYRVKNANSLKNWFCCVI